MHQPKQFIKQGYINYAGLTEMATPVMVTLRHTGPEYYYTYKDTRIVRDSFEECLQEQERNNIKRRIYHTTGTWYISIWQWLNDNQWWNPSAGTILAKVDDKEDIEALLKEEPIITEIPKTPSSQAA